MKTLLTLLFFAAFPLAASAQDPFTLLPREIYDRIPDKLLSLGSTLWIVWWVGSRAFKNWKAGGGWYGVRRAILWGDKTPDAKATDDAKVTEKIAAIEEKRTASQPPFPPPPPAS
jgi:hypothetical protein